MATRKPDDPGWNEDEMTTALGWFNTDETEASGPWIYTLMISCSLVFESSSILPM